MVWKVWLCEIQQLLTKICQKNDLSLPKIWAACLHTTHFFNSLLTWSSWKLNKKFSKAHFEGVSATEFLEFSTLTHKIWKFSPSYDYWWWYTLSNVPLINLNYFQQKERKNELVVLSIKQIAKLLLKVVFQPTLVLLWEARVGWGVLESRSSSWVTYLSQGATVLNPFVYVE